MLTVNLYTFGKLKEPHWREASAEYAKRLSAYCKLNIIELSEARLPENPNEAQINQALEAEASQLPPKLKGYSIALCIEGKMYTSEVLAKTIESLTVDGISTINLIIGSSHGLSEAVKSICKLRLSMSEMTFPHQLARIMLLEQLYRALSINASSKYHK